MNRTRIHILSAYGLIQFVFQASFPHVAGKLSPEFCHLASRIIASVLTSICCPGGLNTMPGEQIVWQIKSDVIQCLIANASLLSLVMELLAKRSKGMSFCLMVVE